MKSVFQMFWRMCLLRQSPAYVPTQSWFVATVLIANLGASVIVSISLEPSVALMEILTRVVVSQAAYAGLVWSACFLREYPTRFAGTITALFGCDLLITSLFGVLVPLFSRLGDSTMIVLPVGYFVWSLAVAGFILSKALAVRFAIGALAALGMTVLATALAQIAVGG
jgi:hypothetical protein